MLCLILLCTEQNPERSAATDDASSNAAGPIKITFNGQTIAHRMKLNKFPIKNFIVNQSFIRAR